MTSVTESTRVHQIDNYEIASANLGKLILSSGIVTVTASLVSGYDAAVTVALFSAFGLPLCLGMVGKNLTEITPWAKGALYASTAIALTSLVRAIL